MKTLLRVIVIFCGVFGAIDQAFAQFSFATLDSTNVGYVGSIKISGNYAYVNVGGLTIIDVSNPAEPVVVGQVPSGGSAAGLTVSGRYAYQAIYGDGLQIYDVTNPSNPVSVGQSYNGDSAGDVTVAGNYAYVTGFPLQIYDVSNPANPFLVGHGLTNHGPSAHVIVSENYAFVTSPNTDHTLIVYDVSNPTNPAAIYLGAFGYDFGEALSSNRLYVAQQGGGVIAYDVSNPASPVSLGHANVDISAGANLAVSNKYAFLANGSRGLQIFDVSNPTNIVSVGSTNVAATALALSGNILYLGSFTGLQILQVVGPQLTVGAVNPNSIAISWPTNLIAFALQENPDLTGTNWVAVTNTPVVANGSNQVILSVSNSSSFFRLVAP